MVARQQQQYMTHCRQDPRKAWSPDSKNNTYSRQDPHGAWSKIATTIHDITRMEHSLRQQQCYMTSNHKHANKIHTKYLRDNRMFSKNANSSLDVLAFA